MRTHNFKATLKAAVKVASLLLFGAVAAFGLSFVESLVVVAFCFFFVAVSARMVGLIGTTNQPVSGMTITAFTPRRCALNATPDA